jgi:Holliday junction resolvase RusA-like endonuclease
MIHYSNSVYGGDITKAKNRKQKQFEYAQKFGHIPVNYRDRLEWMYDEYNINEIKANRILQKRDAMLCSLFYHDIDLVLYQLPEGTPRPRFRLVNRTNMIDSALTNGQFVHVYNLYAKDDSIYMNKMVETEIRSLEQLICTPINVVFNIFLKTPSAFNIDDMFLAEMGLIRPIVKPDYDNLAKKYSDMSNHNIWLDDQMVMSGTVNRYYSVLPRIEINIRFLNMLYNNYQYKAVSGRKDFSDYNCNVDYFKYGGINDASQIIYK